MKNVLVTDQLSKTYYNQIILKKVSMNIPSGAIYGFIGLNGAGKSTFMRIIVGLCNQTSGSITLFENNSLYEGRKRIGCMIESPSLFENNTAFQNLKVYAKLMDCDREQNLRSLLHQVGLTDTGRKKVRNFSLGMKQRLGLAIALIGQPDFLILDEPTNGMDPVGTLEILNLLQELNRKRGVTILISSHILGDLTKIATTYAVIRKGSIVVENDARILRSEAVKEKIEFNDYLIRLMQ